MTENDDVNETKLERWRARCGAWLRVHDPDAPIPLTPEGLAHRHLSDHGCVRAPTAEDPRPRIDQCRAGGVSFALQWMAWHRTELNERGRDLRAFAKVLEAKRLRLQDDCDELCAAFDEHGGALGAPSTGEPRVQSVYRVGSAGIMSGAPAHALATTIIEHAKGLREAISSLSERAFDQRQLLLPADDNYFCRSDVVLTAREKLRS